VTSVWNVEELETIRVVEGLQTDQVLLVLDALVEGEYVFTVVVLEPL